MKCLVVQILLKKSNKLNGGKNKYVTLLLVSPQFQIQRSTCIQSSTVLDFLLQCSLTIHEVRLQFSNILHSKCGSPTADYLNVMRTYQSHKKYLQNKGKFLYITFPNGICRQLIFFLNENVAELLCTVMHDIR